jgi:hypothetical protein
METLTEEQKQTLTEALTRLEYTAIEIVPGVPGQDGIAMLYVNNVFISSALYALSLAGGTTDAELKELIDGAIQAESV